MVTTLKNSTVQKWTWSGAGFTRQTPGEKQPVSAKRLQLYKRARFYDPTTGEFVSADPLEYVDGMSMYRGYMVPSKMDPLGQDVIDPAIIHAIVSTLSEFKETEAWTVSYTHLTLPTKA